MGFLCCYVFFFFSFVVSVRSFLCILLVYIGAPYTFFNNIFHYLAKTERKRIYYYICKEGCYFITMVASKKEEQIELQTYDMAKMQFMICENLIAKWM
jgi:hypothetical protein